MISFLFEKKSFKECSIDLIKKIIEIQKTRLVTLENFFEKLPFFLDDNPKIENEDVLKLLREESSKKVLTEFHKQVSLLQNLTKENLSIVVNNVKKNVNLKGPKLWLPLRYAITLEKEGPDLNLIVDLFGKDKCIRLIERALEL